MIKLTQSQKLWLAHVLDAGASLDLDYPPEKAEYDLMMSAPWFVVLPKENNVETTDEYYCYSIQYERGADYMYEIDCISENCYKNLLRA